MQQTEVNPFLMTEKEFDEWIKKEEEKRNNIHSLLNHLQFIPSLWRQDKKRFLIISKSTKQTDSLQLTLFYNNIPIFDMVRKINDISDIVDYLHTNNATIEIINYIN